jgi:hypothetical protein
MRAHRHQPRGDFRPVLSACCCPGFSRARSRVPEFAPVAGDGGDGHAVVVGGRIAVPGFPAPAAMTRGRSSGNGSEMAEALLMRQPPPGRRKGTQRMLRFPRKWRSGHSWRSEEMRDDGRGDHRWLRCPTRSHLSGLGLTFPLPASPLREWCRHVCRPARPPLKGLFDCFTNTLHTRLLSPILRAS